MQLAHSVYITDDCAVTEVAYCIATCTRAPIPQPYICIMLALIGASWRDAVTTQLAQEHIPHP